MPTPPSPTTVQEWMNFLTPIFGAIILLMQWFAKRDRAVVKEKLDKVTQVTDEKLEKIHKLVDGPFGAVLEKLATLTEEKAAITDSKANGDAAIIARAESDAHNAMKAKVELEAEANKQLENMAKTTDPIWDSRNSDEPKQS